MPKLMTPPPFSSPSADETRPRAGEPPLPPSWVHRLVSADEPGVSRWKLVTVRVPEVTSGELVRTSTARAYSDLYDSLSPGMFPVRFWNLIPGIHHADAAGLDLYMAFNQGRFDAFASRFSDLQAIEKKAPTASGVGHDGAELVIHCLATDRPGEPVENPRQIAPQRYSRKYGPLPPCFARGTKISGTKGETLLLVGGTASIRGENSVHAGDLDAQVEETLCNLAALVQGTYATPAALGCFRELRVYHAQAADGPVLRERLTSTFRNVAEIEFVRADLCRRELLVEIEGVAAL